MLSSLHVKYIILVLCITVSFFEAIPVRKSVTTGPTFNPSHKIGSFTKPTTLQEDTTAQPNFAIRVGKHIWRNKIIYSSVFVLTVFSSLGIIFWDKVTEAFQWGVNLVSPKQSVEQLVTTEIPGKSQNIIYILILIVVCILLVILVFFFKDRSQVRYSKPYFNDFPEDLFKEDIRRNPFEVSNIGRKISPDKSDDKKLPVFESSFGQDSKI